MWRVGKKFIVGIALIAIASPAFGSRKSKPELVLQKSYDAPADRVFTAIVQGVGPTLVNDVKDACLVNFQSRSFEYRNLYRIISWTAMCKDSGDGKTVVTLRYQVNSNLFGDKSAVTRESAIIWGNIDVALRNMGPPNSTASSAPPDASNADAKAAVTVTSVPQGAVISIDGGYVGNTPSDLQVTPGTHTLKVELKGYEPWEHTIKVEAGETRRFNAELSEKSAQQLQK